MAAPIPDEVCVAAMKMILRAAWIGDAEQGFARTLSTTRNVLQAVADHAEDSIHEAASQNIIARKLGKKVPARPRASGRRFDPC